MTTIQKIEHLVELHNQFKTPQLKLSYLTEDSNYEINLLTASNKNILTMTLENNDVIAEVENTNVTFLSKLTNGGLKELIEKNA